MSEPSAPALAAPSVVVTPAFSAAPAVDYGSYDRFDSFKAYLNRHEPDMPVHALRPAVLRAATQWFIRHFPGTAMYAVKCNPDPLVIRTLAAAGLKHFDVASIPEIELVREYAPDAELFYMHPVKSRPAIRKAYFDYGVRHFSLDCEAELAKIMEETGHATDLHLHIRLSLPKGEAFHALSEKFGAPEAEACALLVKARAVARKVGLCFHVGSQTMSPQPYATALGRVSAILKETGVRIDSLDVGGGFPVAYPTLAPRPMDEFMATLKQALSEIELPALCTIYGEPGRALVAEAGSLLVKVDLRKDMAAGSALYINDGAYGSLFDAALMGLVHPVRLHRMAKRPAGPVAITSRKPQDFIIYGPTCDSVDTIKGYQLPADVQEGDYLEFGQTGAYTFALQSKFNGFYSEELVLLDDQPQLVTPGYWSR